MKIGIMLRCVDEKGGIGVYARNVVPELLQNDNENEYFLFYSKKANIGRYKEYNNAKEMFIYAPNRAIWDQLAIPYVVKKEKIDIIFHPKFTLPLFTEARTVMVLHGADWFLPEYKAIYNKLDVMYLKKFMPLYLKKASRAISVSNYCTEGFVSAFPWAKDKIQTIYFGPHKMFRPILDTSILTKIRLKYRLPERFILTVIRYDSGTKNIRKNFGGMIQAYKLCKERGIPQKFVVIGKDCNLYADEYNILGMGLAKDVFFPGYVEQSDLPALYSLADLYLYPTLIEAFPIPITEALACGCPIVTSHGTGLRELAGNAAVLVDPMKPLEIADGMCRLLADEYLRQHLRRKGLEQSKRFSWDKCGRETLAVLKNLNASPSH
jgi:glycosyltransferase involved in cell wall biosynthesis